MKYFLIIIALLTFITSCDQSKLVEVPESRFLGKWKLVDRGLLDGIEIKISKDKKGKFNGEIIKLNNNKYVVMFMEVGEDLVSGITRKSNFEFALNEKKIAAELFSSYGQSTSEELSVQFEGKDKIMIGKNGSSGHYLRIK